MPLLKKRLLYSLWCTLIELSYSRLIKLLRKNQSDQDGQRRCFRRQSPTHPVVLTFLREETVLLLAEASDSNIEDLKWSYI